MFTHVLDHAGATLFARDLPARPDAFLHAIEWAWRGYTPKKSE
jgi:hypothetical protein